MSRHPWSRLGEPNAGRQPWSQVWVPDWLDDKWTIHTARSETMTIPSKTDLETLAIRLGCPPHLVEAGIVLTFVHETRTLDHLSGRRDVCGVASPFADHLRHGGRWWIMAGARRDTGALGAGCPVPGWSKLISDVPDGVPVAAFWALWDSVGDLNPETKQAGREAEVAGKRNAPVAATQKRITEAEVDRLRKASAHPAYAAARIAQATIAAAEMFQTMLAGRPAEPAWIEYGRTWDEFRMTEMNRPGVEIESCGRVMLIGDVVTNGGRARGGDVLDIGPDDDVARYRVLLVRAQKEEGVPSQS